MCFPKPENFHLLLHDHHHDHHGHHRGHHHRGRHHHDRHDRHVLLHCVEFQ